MTARERHGYRLEQVGALYGVGRYAGEVRVGWALPPQDDRRRAENLVATANLAAEFTTGGGGTIPLGRERANRCKRPGCSNPSPVYELCSGCWDEWNAWRDMEGTPQAYALRSGQWAAAFPNAKKRSR